MKGFKVTLAFTVAEHVTKEFVESYFEKMMKEKIHNPVDVNVEEIQIEDKL
jgi:hypothetical protein